MLRKRSVAIFALIVLLLPVLGLPVQAQSLTETTFFLTFVPNIQFSPMYVGLEKGYFEANGIQVTLEYGDENVGVDLMAADERQFGIISGEEVIKARANQRMIVSVYEWFQKYPIGIVTSDNSGIASIADLVGKKVGVPGRFGASYNALTALLIANGLTESDIDLQEIGFNAPDVFCVGAVDASVVYINNEPLQIQQRADAGECNGITGLTVFPVSETIDMVSNGLVTNEQTLTNNPTLVQGMVNAFDAALRDAINNPAETYLLSAAHVENLPLDDAFKTALEAAAAAQVAFLATDPSREAIAESRTALLTALSAQFDEAALLQFQVLLNTIELWDADQLGYADLFSWEVTQEVLTQMSFVDSPIDLSLAFTNDFLPGAEG